MPRRPIVQPREASPATEARPQIDRVLGMQQRITRRDFLNASLLASGSMLLTSASPTDLLAARPNTGTNRTPPGANSQSDDWTGYGGTGDYANSNGNTRAVLEAGHQIRDGMFETLPAGVIDTGETYDCVIVGGGISGLAAALVFQRQAAKGATCLVVDNHPIFGGEAKRNEFLVDGHRLMAHQGSAFFPVPYPHSFIGRFYESIGLKTPRLEYQKWDRSSPEIAVSRTPYLGSSPSGLYFGAKFGHPEGLWLTDPWGKKLDGAPLPVKAREELLKFQAAGDPGTQAPQICRRRYLAAARHHHSGGADDGTPRHQPRNHSRVSVAGRRRRIWAWA